MWSKLRKGIKYLRRGMRYPSFFISKFDSIMGRIRARIEYNSRAYISPKSKITVPEQMQIGNNTKIYPHTVLKPKINGIIVGDNCTIHEFGFIAGDVSIGNDVRIAQKVSIHSFNHKTDPSEKIRNQELDHGAVTIGDDVWIGCDVTILKDVHIGTGAVIGAGSIVTEDVPAYTVVAGNPAKPIKKRK